GRRPGRAREGESVQAVLHDQEARARSWAYARTRGPDPTRVRVLAGAGQARRTLPNRNPVSLQIELDVFALSAGQALVEIGHARGLQMIDAVLACERLRLDPIPVPVLRIGHRVFDAQRLAVLREREP